MEQSNSTLSAQGVLRTLSFLYFTFLITQLFFAFFAYMQQGNTYFEFEDPNDVFIYAVPILAVAAFVGSMLLYREQISQLSGKNTREKFVGYQSACLLRMAFLEAGCLFGIIAFFLKGNLFSLLFSGLIVLYFVTLRPSKEKVESDLDLS